MISTKVPSALPDAFLESLCVMKDLACKDFLKLVNGLIGHVIYSRGKLSDRHVMFRGADLTGFMRAVAGE